MGICGGSRESHYHRKIRKKHALWAPKYKNFLICSVVYQDVHSFHRLEGFLLSASNIVFFQNMGALWAPKYKNLLICSVVYQDVHSFHEIRRFFIIRLKYRVFFILCLQMVKKYEIIFLGWKSFFFFIKCLKGAGLLKSFNIRQ